MGKNDDQDEAGVGDDLVVGLALPALAAVVGERDRRHKGGRADGEQRSAEHERDGRRGARTGEIQADRSSAMWPFSSHPTSPRTWWASRSCAGVSFTLERRDRLTLSGRNGAGKTTLLRMLSGETSIDGGELSWPRTCGSRCTTSGRHGSATQPARLRAVGRKDLLALEERLTELEHRMADGATDGATLEAYATRAGPAGARGRLQLARGRQRHPARPRLPRRAPGPEPARRSAAAS